MKKMNPVACLTLCLIAAGAPLPAAHAVTDTLDTVTVRGQTENKARHKSVPGTVNTISARQIETLPAQDATEVLRRVPGINYADEDGRGLKPNIGLRGLDPTRSRNVTLLLDGFPVQPSSFGDPSAYFNVPLEDIDHIEVVKGPASLLYHGNTLGGVINYVTKQPPADKKVELTQNNSFGEDSLFTNQTGLAGTVEDLKYQVSYTRKQGEGFRESDRFGVHDVGIHLNYELNEHSEITSNTFVYHENSDTPGGLSRARYDADHLQSVTPDDQFEGRRVHTNLTYRNQFTENQSLESYFYYTFFSRDWFIASTVSSGNTMFLRDFNVFGFGGKYELLYDLFGLDNNTFTFGNDYYFDKEDDLGARGDTATAKGGTITADNDLTTFAFDFYATTQLNLTDKFRISPIARVDFVRNGLENNLLETQGHNIMAVWSPGVGAEYDVLDNTTLYASFHRSFQPAEYKESINPTTGSDQNLDPQQGTHFEAGVRTQPISWFSMNAAVFTFDFNNEIITVSGTRVNGQETRHSGVEAVLNLDLFDMFWDLAGREKPEVLGRLTTDFGLTLLDTDFRKGPASGNELPQAPNWQYTWGLHYELPQGFFASLTSQFVDEQFSSANNSRIENAAATTGTIPTYKIWDLKLGYTWKERYGIFFGIKNLFDEKYFTRRDTFFTGITPSPDRQVYFGTKIKLG